MHLNEGNYKMSFHGETLDKWIEDYYSLPKVNFSRAMHKDMNSCI